MEGRSRRRKDQPGDTLWAHVEKMDGGRFKCRFCGQVFAPKTSITRITFHLSGLEGHGVKICEGVPTEVQHAASVTAIHRPQKKRKTMPSSSNGEVNYTISTPQEPNNGGGNEVAYEGLPVSPTTEWMDLFEQEGAIPTAEIVGQAFGKNKDSIWSLLTKDDFSSIGIYGMVGVGKTELAKHIHNMLLLASFHSSVCWIDELKDFSIYKLQGIISKSVGLDFSKQENEKKRAAALSKFLTEKGQFVLILDGLWNHFEPHEVGIPVGVNGCKLVITTSSLEICRRMDCQESIKVEPISDKEAWNLFKNILGDYSYSVEIEHLARAVASECAGLPLAIRTMARSLRRVDEAHVWRNAVEELKFSEVRKGVMEAEVFRRLKLSYNYLNDPTVQKCFLYCALFPKEWKIEREELIKYLIVEGFIGGRRSRQSEFDKGHEMLSKLESACLLECCINTEKRRCVKMHDLMRDMAIQIMRVKYGLIVAAGEKLDELPGAEKWTEDLVTVSLMENCIEKIPSSFSPKCFNLSTLLLCKNKGLKSIPGSFFKQLLGLKVLDLYDTGIEFLPDSISDLVSLTALLLRRCEMLRHVPSLAELKILKELDLSDSGIQTLPEGMKCLSNLRSLNLYATKLKLPAELLLELSSLQILRISTAVEAKEVGRLIKLEILQCHLVDLAEMNTYVFKRLSKQMLSNYSFLVGQTDNNDRQFMGLYGARGSEAEFNKKVWLYNCGLRVEDQLNVWSLPEDFQVLMISKCHGITSLCEFSPISGGDATNLKSISILHCDCLERLMVLPLVHPDALRSLKTINLEHLNNLKVLFARKEAAATRFPNHGTFSNLKRISVSHCPSMKKLFPLEFVQNLINVEAIQIKNCCNLVEIIEEEGIICEESSSKSANVVGLPKLKLFELDCLRELRSIFSGKMTCASLQQITIFGCPELKRMPFCLPFCSTFEKISICPKEWWESVLWDHPNAKIVLQPRVSIVEAASV